METSNVDMCLADHWG